MIGTVSHAADIMQEERVDARKAQPLEAVLEAAVHRLVAVGSTGRERELLGQGRPIARRMLRRLQEAPAFRREHEQRAR